MRKYRPLFSQNERVYQGWIPFRFTHEISACAETLNKSQTHNHESFIPFIIISQTRISNCTQLSSPILHQLVRRISIENTTSKEQKQVRKECINESNKKPVHSVKKKYRTYRTFAKTSIVIRCQSSLEAHTTLVNSIKTPQQIYSTATQDPTLSPFALETEKFVENLITLKYLIVMANIG